MSRVDPKMYRLNIGSVRNWAHAQSPHKRFQLKPINQGTILSSFSIVENSIIQRYVRTDPDFLQSNDIIETRRFHELSSDPNKKFLLESSTRSLLRESDRKVDLHKNSHDLIKILHAVTTTISPSSTDTLYNNLLLKIGNLVALQADEYTIAELAYVLLALSRTPIRGTEPIYQRVAEQLSLPMQPYTYSRALHSLALAKAPEEVDVVFKRFDDFLVREKIEPSPRVASTILCAYVSRQSVPAPKLAKHLVKSALKEGTLSGFPLDSAASFVWALLELKAYKSNNASHIWNFDENVNNEKEIPMRDLVHGFLKQVIEQQLAPNLEHASFESLGQLNLAFNKAKDITRDLPIVEKLRKDLDKLVRESKQRRKSLKTNTLSKKASLEIDPSYLSNTLTDTSRESGVLLADLCTRLRKFGENDRQVWNRVADRIVHVTSLLKPADVADILQGLSGAKVGNPDIYKQLANRLVETCGEFPLADGDFESLAHAMKALALSQTHAPKLKYAKGHNFGRGVNKYQASSIDDLFQKFDKYGLRAKISLSPQARSALVAAYVYRQKDFKNHRALVVWMADKARRNLDEHFGTDFRAGVEILASLACLNHSHDIDLFTGTIRAMFEVASKAFTQKRLRSLTMEQLTMLGEAVRWAREGSPSDHGDFANMMNDFQDRIAKQIGSLTQRSTKLLELTNNKSLKSVDFVLERRMKSEVTKREDKYTYLANRLLKEADRSMMQNYYQTWMSNLDSKVKNTERLMEIVRLNKSLSFPQQGIKFNETFLSLVVQSFDEFTSVEKTELMEMISNFNQEFKVQSNAAMMKLLVRLDPDKMDLPSLGKVALSTIRHNDSAIIDYAQPIFEEFVRQASLYLLGQDSSSPVYFVEDAERITQNEGKEYVQIQRDDTNTTEPLKAQVNQIVKKEDTEDLTRATQPWDLIEGFHALLLHPTINQKTLEKLLPRLAALSAYDTLFRFPTSSVPAILNILRLSLPFISESDKEAFMLSYNYLLHQTTSLLPHHIKDFNTDDLEQVRKAYDLDEGSEEFEKVRYLFESIEKGKRDLEKENRIMRDEQRIKLQTIQYNARRLGDDKTGQKMLSQLNQLMSLPEIDYNTCVVLSLRAHLSVPQLSIEEISYAINAFVLARMRPKEFFSAAAKKISKYLAEYKTVDLEKVGEALYSLALSGVRSKEVDQLFTQYLITFKRSPPNLTPKITEKIIDAFQIRNIFDPDFFTTIMKKVHLDDYTPDTLVNVFYSLVKAGALVPSKLQPNPAHFGDASQIVARSFMQDFKLYFNNDNELSALNEQNLQRLFAALEMSKWDDQSLLEIQERVSAKLSSLQQKQKTI